MNKLRVLCVNFTLIGDKDATGQTLHNLLPNVDECNYLQYCLDYDANYHENEVETIYADIKSNYVFYILKSAYRKVFKIGKDNNVLELNTQKGLKFHLRELGICTLDLIKHRISGRDVDRIRNFNPDLIYTQGGSIVALNVSNYLSEELGIPIVMHIMDDWISTKYTNSFLTRLGRNKILCLFEKVLIRTPYMLCISKKMANEYQNRYGIPCDYAMNCVMELNNHDCSKNNNDYIRFVFSGGLHGGRGDILNQIGQVIGSINNNGYKIKLMIYTSKVERDAYRWIENRNVELHEYVPKTEMFKNLSLADVLVHVESFDDSKRRYFKYSMSTKIPEYLSVGRPILCYGPQDVCSVEYLKTVKVGWIVNNIEELEYTIMDIVKNSMQRTLYARNALYIAEQNHITNIVCKRIRGIFDRAVMYNGFANDIENRHC